MKVFYSFESAKNALKTLSGDAYLTLDEVIKTVESLVDLKRKFFEGEDGEETREIYSLLKKVNCSGNDPTRNILEVEMMVSCGGPSTWIKIDFNDNVTVKTFWGDRAEIHLSEIGVTLDEVLEIYPRLLN
jgi:hypothetical protein